MTLPDTPAPQAVDCSGRPLTEGDPVAFITTDPISLSCGHVRVIGPNDLCIDTGHNLVVFPALPAEFGLSLGRPLGGKSTPYPIPDGAQQYRHVALQPAWDGA